MAGESTPPEGFDLADFFISEQERDQSRAEATASQPGSATPAAEGVLDILSFHAGREEYGLPISDLQEIMKVPPITQVPRVQAQMLGIMSLRGTIVPVFDLRMVLGVSRPAWSKATRLLVLRADDAPLALLVDVVRQVVRVGYHNLEPRSGAGGVHTNRYVACIGHVGARMLIVLDAVALRQGLEVR